MAITHFTKEHRWLSNFHPIKVRLGDLEFPTTEHAYQAAKSADIEVQKLFREIEKPGDARKIGQSIEIDDIERWNGFRKFQVMEDLQRQKFSDPELRKRLLATDDAELIEGNWWHDNCWGSCSCPKCGNKGQNELGKIIMKIRAELKTTSNVVSEK